VSGMRVLMVYRRDRYLRGGDHIPFSNEDSPLSGSPNRTKIIAISIKMCASKMAPNTATCRSMTTSITSPTSPE